MTWNVLWRFDPDWRARERGILTVLDRLRPDVIGLQESWGSAEGSQADLVADRLGAHSAFLAPSLPPTPAPGRDDQAGIDLGVGLVSRWPIETVTRHDLPVTHRQVPPVALQASIAHPQHPFEVIVAATEWEPAFADDHLAQTARLAELVTTGPPTPRFLLADLNCDPTMPEFAPLTDGIDDTWALAGGGPRAVTLSSRVPYAPLEAVKEIDRRIDHVLTRGDAPVHVEGAFVEDSAVDGLFPSDHFAVVVDLQIVDGGAPPGVTAPRAAAPSR